MKSPTRIFFIVAIILTLIFGALLIWATNLHFYWTWVLTLSVVTFLLYGYDKLQAKLGGLRIPEIVLHALAFLGGFLGGWLGRQVFRHKTRKKIFTVVLTISTILHLVIIYYLFIRAA